MRQQLKEWVVPTVVGVTSFGLGVGVGYFLRRKIEKEIKKDEELIEEMQSQVTQLAFMFEERDQKSESHIQQMSRVAKEFAEKVDTNKHPSNGIIKNNEKRKAEILPIHSKEVDEFVVNVFQSDDDDDWDYEEEEQTRSPDHPYIIHRDEYDENEDDYSQSSLMYYAGDNILCDEHDVPVYNPEKIVGKLNFGHGSKDPSICYIRNDHLQAEYEIIFDAGSFQEEVLGQTDGIKHSRQVLKFRME